MLTRRAAFTLVELTITLLILGILAAVAAPKVVDAMSEAQVRAAARYVAADLQYACQHAKSQGASKTVTFDPAADSYELVGMAPMDRPHDAYVVDLTADPYAASLSSASFGSDGTALQLTFNPFGRPDYGGSLVVVVGSRQRTVVVDGVSGSVTVQP